MPRTTTDADDADEAAEPDERGPLARLTVIFAAQDGLATHAQLTEVGVTRGMRRGRLASGEWRQVDRSVVGIAAMADTWRRCVRLAHLSVGPNSAISHATAGRLHAFDGVHDEDIIHVTVFGDHHHTAPAGVVVHRSTIVKVKATVSIDAIRVVSKPIALIQMAATGSEDRLRQALDGVLRGGANPLWVRQVAQQWRRGGVSGPRAVLEMLDATEERLPRSWFQRLAKGVLAATGLRLVDEFPVGHPTTHVHLADLDLAAPELLVGIECQSWRWHATPSARAADAVRKRRLRRLGWDIIELWWADLDRPDEVLADIADAIARQRAARSPTGLT